ncbi:hypothetical protein CNMCM8927_003501 [Aspergillus lentulus]|uniref:Malonyl-CoA:ACP transacylase (MAT) domain-containing protein n=1 Tax=Aspergillus lentulus TaxID=293939 RepID=A0AAN6BKX0_ASPLE|nr:hypothetical protein CNMCM8927_003501 [Aspergillus lentulus]
METARSRVIFFGNEFPSDDLKDLFHRLHQHSKDRRFRLLPIFLEEWTAILKDEVAKLSQPLKEQGALGAAMESALLTVLELETIGIAFEILEAKGIKYTLLDVQFAFHTTQMDLVLNALESLAAPVPFKALSISVLSPLLGTTVFDDKLINAPNFYISKSLLPSHTSYVRMFPLLEDANMYAGDVYILQGMRNVGMVGKICFHPAPWLLMDWFFSPPASTTMSTHVPPVPAGPCSAPNTIVKSAPVTTSSVSAILAPEPIPSSTTAFKAWDPAPSLLTSPSEDSSPKGSPITTPPASAWADAMDNGVVG